MTTTGTKQRDATGDTPAVPDGMGKNGLGTNNGYIGGGWGDEVRSSPSESSWALQAGGPPASKRNF
jgi:hypothetical protein